MKSEKKRVLQDQFVEAVCSALGVEEWQVHMPSRTEGFVWVVMSVRGREWNLTIPNDTLAEMIWGDRWDGDASDSAFRFGGGGYDPFWFECGVLV